MATDDLAIKTLRALCIDAVQAANSGHPGAPLGLAPLGWSLFSKLRKHDPSQPEWFDRDRFVLSCGHASMLQYALLHLTGYDVSLQDIRKFRQWGSKTPGHPEYGHTPGVETTTGPLGQGFANAVGMAMAEHQLAQRFNRHGVQVVDHKTWVIASDGDLMEGVCAEAASLAGHLRLSKLIVFWDDNRITIDGSTDLSFTEDVCARFRSYGWQTLEVPNGEDVEAIVHAGRQAAEGGDKPTLIRVRTTIGYPSPNKQGTSASHGAPLGKDEVALTKKALGVPTEDFFVPEEVSSLKNQVVSSGSKARKAWEASCAQLREKDRELADEFLRVIEGRLPNHWDRDLPLFAPHPKGEATRKSSGTVLQKLAQNVSEIVGGSADLAGSNNSYLDGESDFGGTSEKPPRNIHFGVREHAMAAACNGMALHGGILPYAATFLIFSDYLRPSIRLAALMKLPVRYVFTHDSIGLGEDGPTHQPVEQLASLRCIPGFRVFRPADASETREAWKTMMKLDGPSAIVLSRQALPILDRQHYASEEGVSRGAYVLSKEASSRLDAILIATGSEVSLALAAQDALAKENLSVRVVSMPSCEQFHEQEAAFQESVLPRAVQARVAVEAGSRFGWERWVGQYGGFVTIDRFGASAPAEVLFEQYGMSVDRVVQETQRVIQQAQRS